MKESSENKKVYYRIEVTKINDLLLSNENHYLDIFNSITKQEEAKKGPSKETSISPQERETIRALKREGWTINEIASRFKRTPTEIDLLLSLPE